MDEILIGTICIAIFAVVATIIGIANMYTVVPPHQAHVVVSRGKGRKVYSTRAGEKSSYWRVPIVQQRAIIPIENVQIRVDDIPLRDKNMAKFLGDVVAWLNIDDPLLAAERIGKVASRDEITSDVSNVIQAITRNKSMYWTVIDIMTKRKDFSDDVEKDVNLELKEWGMRLVELEVIHFADEKPYTVIQDLEARQSTVINSETRKLVAGQNKEAAIVESSAKKDTELTVALNEETYRKKQIEKDETIGRREQEKEMNIAEQTKMANEKKIEAVRTMTVGQADITKQAAIKKAEGEAEANIKTGQAQANVTKVTGEAEGDVIKAKGLADAIALDKRADALKKFNEAGISLEVINASKTVQIAQADAWAKAMSAAKIQVYSGGSMGDSGASIMGIPLNPQSGFNFGAFAEIAKEHGMDLQKVLESIAKGSLVVVDPTKLADAKGKK